MLRYSRLAYMMCSVSIVFTTLFVAISLQRPLFGKTNVNNKPFFCRIFSEMKTVARKMGIKEHSRTLLVDAPADAIKAIQLPQVDVSKNMSGEFDYIHLFVINLSSFKDKLPKLKPHLKSSGMLWVSWPKGGGLGTDLSLPKVIDAGYTFGLVESTCLSIDSVWSAIKFTHPKKGKTYNNSYGELKERTTDR